MKKRTEKKRNDQKSWTFNWTKNQAAFSILFTVCCWLLLLSFIFLNIPLHVKFTIRKANDKFKCNEMHKFQIKAHVHIHSSTIHTHDASRILPKCLYLSSQQNQQ